MDRGSGGVHHRRHPGQLNGPEMGPAWRTVGPILLGLIGIPPVTVPHSDDHTHQAHHRDEQIDPQHTHSSSYRGITKGVNGPTKAPPCVAKFFGKAHAYALKFRRNLRDSNF